MKTQNGPLRACFWVVALCLLPSVLAFQASPAIAHKVEVSGQVGGTQHIEPNDTPRAGESSLVWFALARKGGAMLPLAACDCKLAVYAQPRQPGDRPILEPILKPVTVEGYADIPGADITFPQVGAYVLVVQGTPKQAGAFQPFELTFQSTVAVGQTAASPSSSSSSPSAASPEPDSAQTASPSAKQPENPSIEMWPMGAIAGGTILAIGIRLGLVLGRKLRGDRQKP